MKEIFYEIFHFPLLEYFAAINKIFKDDTFYDKDFLKVLLKTLFDRRFNIWMIFKIVMLMENYNSICLVFEILILYIHVIPPQSPPPAWLQ